MSAADYPVAVQCAVIAFALVGFAVLSLKPVEKEAVKTVKPPRPRFVARVAVVEPIRESPVATRAESTSPRHDDDLGLLPPKGGRRGR